MNQVVFDLVGVGLAFMAFAIVTAARGISRAIRRHRRQRAREVRELAALVKCTELLSRPMLRAHRDEPPSLRIYRP